mmetsp:Transcript_104847/g.272826  ORF Transcript_104847/g.272826 Transcript_104847/m.272826 type:complete len:158 (+) Transcript_104847:76-549(+)|eukprot:CAMPEP_0183432548 /NCGR_PEP_ID=MMETSP0370-20130417/58152_1 /TAXON_ID=268820 /ORGANISM="Peridinium aciculiferum, Strain PAER-2" /LENGTH=157 /DNA_ID=CAMNT_0025618575 /DNA_START=76 /DNA_END=549 /DNA_ORIENTATION=-
MGRKGRDADDSSDDSGDERRAKDKDKDKKKREEKKTKRSRSRSRGDKPKEKERRGKSRGRSAERKPAAPEKKRGRSASSSSGKSSEDEEEMKEFLLSTDMPEDQMLVKMMGFSAFDSSKGRDHSTSDLSDVKRATKRQYRQYMNRRGGFNRPLDAAF